MSKRTIVTCDECGAVRKESNHWFSLTASATMPKLSTSMKPINCRSPVPG